MTVATTYDQNSHNNRLKEAYIIFTMGIAEGFFGCNCPKPERIWMLLEYKCGTKVHMHKKFPEITTGDPLNAAKMCFVFFLSPIQHGLSENYPALILIMFETTDVNWCTEVYICEKFPNFYSAMLCIRGTSRRPVSVCLSVSICHKPLFY